jgi:seryl-tRNA synthetase
MLEIQLLREKRDEVIERLSVKNFDAATLVDSILQRDEERRSTKKRLDDILAESNRLAREIGNLFKEGKRDEAEKIKVKSASLKNESKKLNQQHDDLTRTLNELLVQLPNLPHGSVPPGKTPDDNEIVSEKGEKPSLPKEALPHWELAAKYNIIDFDLGSKVTGAGFPFYRGAGAKLQRALINFFLDEALETGYTEFQPPLFVNEESAYGTGQLPDKDGQMYHIPVDNLYPIPTAEVPITNIYRDVILRPEDLPIKNAAYSSCFRREAGSYGKDVRGLNRLHQFDKVEIVQVTHPGSSYQTLEEMKEYAALLLEKLELPYRILRLCGGDMSFTAALTYDFEVYSAAQHRWLEVSSVSNFESYQANRMKLRIKDTDGRTKFAHTRNGSALALPRIVAALLENNQQPEGIRIPASLTKYTGFEIIQ